MKKTFAIIRAVVFAIMMLVMSGCRDNKTQPDPLQLTLEQRIGQMIMVGFRGLDVTDNSAIIRDIRRRNIGSVVLYDYDVALKSDIRNIRSAEQLKKLIRKLQDAADTGLLVAVDQEGGRVCRLKEQFGFDLKLSPKYFGQQNSIELTYGYAEMMAETLKEVGINLNFAPVVDLDINPDNPVIGRLGRSFSADPDIVVEHARQFILAHHRNGVLCTLKHFPGHGSSAQDSHLGLTDVTFTWSISEIEPYQRLIEEGLVDAVMTAHIYNADLDVNFPATMSGAIITDMLRNQLGFNGVVISDDMQMGAIASQYGFEYAIEKTINAGVDIILIANNLTYDEAAAAKAISVINRLVHEDRISTKRINESYKRIQNLKKKISN